MLGSNIGRCRSVVEMPGTSHDGRQHKGGGIATGRDRQPRKGHAGENGVRRSNVRHPQRWRRVEVHDPRNKRHWFVLQLPNAEAAHFEKTSKGGRRPCDKAVMNSLDMNAVVRHQTRKDDEAAGRSVNEVEHEP
jgi:hypothetical protein